MKKELDKLIAIFCISLIVLTPFYLVDVSAQSPEIDVELPRYYNGNEIDITGTTVPFATVKLYVNDELRRILGSEETGEEGIINFQGVVLAKENIIKILAEDQAGAANEAIYEITVDTENPQIDLDEIPSLIGDRNLTVKGSVNENVTINFYLGLGAADNERPAKITGLVAVDVDKNSIELEWDESSDSDFAKYILYREDVGAIAITKPANYNSFSDVLVNSGLTYTYTVTAMDRAGNEGPKSDPLTVTTLEGDTRTRRNPDEVSLAEARAVEHSIQTDGAFEVSLEPRNDDIYTLTIEVIDLAQNKVELKHEFILDTTPPEFKNIEPESGDLIYENFADRVNIGGYTDPLTEVSLFINKTRFERTEYSASSDSEGYFKFMNVDLTRFSGFGVHEVSPEQLGDYYAGEIQIMARTADVHLEATDALGRTATKKVRYRIGTCWSGNLTWDVKPFPEYQSPTLLSTERIAEGSEWIYFMLNLSYAREGTGKVNSLSVSKACDDYVRNDPKYNWSCRIMPSTCVTEPSPDKTSWFISCHLGRMEEMDRWLEDDWKSFFKAINSEMIFPFRLRIRYSYEVDGKQGSEHQTTCFPVTYVVDNTKINFKDVLPDWLLYDTADWLENSVKRLEETQDFLEDLIEKIGALCLGSYAVKSLVKFYRKYTCYMDAFKKLSTPPKLEELRYLKQSERDKLSNEELAKFESCVAAWDFESKVYTVYRALCDRIFCHGAPARWTEDKTDKELIEAVKAEEACITTNTDLGQPIRRVKCRELWRIYGTNMAPEREDIPLDAECFEIWKRKDKDIERFVYGQVFDEPGLPYNIIKLGRYEQRPSKTDVVYAIKSGDDFYLTKRAETCEEVCEERGYESAGCKIVYSEDANVESCNKLNDEKRIANSFGFTNDCYYDGGDDFDVIIGGNDEREECCCVKESEDEPSKYYKEDDLLAQSDKPAFVDENGKNTFEEFSYRYYSMGFKTRDKENPKEIHSQYNPYKYLKGRDVTACFGQNNLLDGILEPLTGRKTVYLDPFKSHWPAIQCGCLTGVYNRITALKNMMAAMNACLIQVRTTGTADAGVCKEVFSQYVCSLLWRLISLSQDECYSSGIKEPLIGPDKEIAAYARGGTTALWETVSEAGADLQQDYGNVQLTNFLGYGQEATARKICLAAFGYDWDIEGQNLLDIAYAVPYASLVQPVTKTREYLTFDPTKGKGAAKYDYRASWLINPGCDIDDYDVYLTCVSRDEMDAYTGINCNKQQDPEGINCDCLSSNKGASQLFYDGRRLNQGELEDRAKNEAITSQHRYDHLKFVLKPSRLINTQELKANCFPEGHYDYGRDEAVFYFPIRDKTASEIAACSVDVVSGEFTCPSSRFFWGTEMNGQLITDQIKINGQYARDGILLYAGEDDLRVQPTVWKSPEGPDMCLYINVYGEGNFEEKRTFKPVNVPGTYEFPEITLLEPEDLKFRGISFDWPRDANGGSIQGDLIEPTMLIRRDELELPIGFKDNDDPPDGKIDLGEDSKDLMYVGDINWVDISRQEHYRPNEIEITKHRVRDYKVKLRIWGVRLPTIITDTGEEKTASKFEGTLKIFSESRARSYEEKRVEFILTNLGTGIEVYTGDEQDCNLHDVVKYRGESQKKSYTIIVRTPTGEEESTTTPSTPQPTPTTPTTTTQEAEEPGTSCGHSQAVKQDFTKPSRWSKYLCMEQEEAKANEISWDDCLSRTVYSTADISQTHNVGYGCSGAEMCCPPAEEETPAPTTPPAQKGWTAWYNQDDAGGTGDYEPIDNIQYVYPEKFCDNPIYIECQTTDGVDHVLTRQTVVCNLDYGFYCKNDENPEGCLDYKVRLYCEELIQSTWTQWFNLDDFDGGGDYESIDTIKNTYPGKICDNPTQIKCQTVSGVDYTETGEKVVCNLDYGFYCKNDENPPGCLDYKVKFYCGG